MRKRTFGATVNGKTYTRKTVREYTHVVVLQHSMPGIDQAMFCGSLALAQKQLAAWQDMTARGYTVTLIEAAEVVS